MTSHATVTQIVVVGTAFAQGLGMLIASINVWSDPVDDRACRVIVYEDACELVVEKYGQRVLTFDCGSVAAAMDTAAAYQREYSTADMYAA
jgi:hypothetical protein